VRVAAVLFCLQLAYLATANAILASRLIQTQVGKSQGFLLEFGRAYSLWPGHVRVRDLLLRFEDYNIQFQLKLASADVDISLTELWFKKFHVTDLDAEGTSFRLRHKLIVVGDDAERIAAYPKIPGFADPPYFVGLPTPPVADEDYDLWQVQIEHVNVRVSELWLMEYRFQGQGVARGSFIVKPSRWVQVEPASLVLERGKLTLGEHLVAEQVRGRLRCSIPDYHVQEREGREVFRDVSAAVKLELEGGQLDFLRAYLDRLAPVRYSGAASWLIDFHGDHGVVQPGSHLELRAPDVHARYRQISLSGPLSGVLERRAGDPQLRLAVSSPLLRAERQPPLPNAPRFEQVDTELRLEAADLSAPMSVGASRVAVKRALAPSLAWFDVPDTTLGGAAQIGFDLERAADGQLSGQADLALNAGHVERAGFAARVDLRSELRLTRAGRAGTPVHFDRLRVDASRCELRAGERRSKPFAANVDATGLELALGDPPSARGLLRVHVSSTEALLPLFTTGLARTASDALLDLGSLDARARLRIAAGGVEVSGLDARDGDLQVRGGVAKRNGDPRGAFLVSSGPLNVGVRLQGGDTEVSPLVGDDWLATAQP
jgi:hypothetical protein